MKIRRADLERLLAQTKEIHSSNVDYYARAVKEQYKYEPRSNEYNLAVHNVKHYRDIMEQSALVVGNLGQVISHLDDLGELE